MREIWARIRRGAGKVSGGGRRVLAGALALVLTLGLVHFTLPQAAGADDYAKELEARKAEYANKFNMDTLMWSTSGKAPDGTNVNYGTTARNYLYWQPGSFGGVAYMNYIHVYAFEGDTICFGSDVYNSTLNAEGTGVANATQKTEIENRLGAGATVDIVLTDLRNNRILYDVKPNGAGHIPDVQTEVLAKTMESPSGNSKEDVAVTTYTSSGAKTETKDFTYTPLTYKVTETGVYTIEFHSYDNGNNDGQTTKNDTVDNNTSGTNSRNNVANNFYRPQSYTTDASGKTLPQAAYREPTDAQHGGVVAAWDVSVFNEQGHKETGRVYADYLSLQQNGGYNVVETYYVVTTDSYIYRWDWNGNRPNTYNFFADNQGLTDNATGSSLYKSVKELTNTGFDYTRFGASYKYPGSTNTDQSKSYYIFFEKPNEDLEGHLYTRAIQPDPAENIRFVDEITDEDGNTVPGSYVGLGGYFAFDTKEATTATLVLNFDKLTKDGETDPLSGYAPVTISGPVKPYSTNYFYWDGKDGKGVVIPAGDYKIEDLITLTTKAGEIHFPIHDQELASGGFTFTRVSPIYDREGNKLSDNGDNNILDATKNVIYYNDSAIYYGEHVGRTGLAENLVRSSDTASTKTLREANPGKVKDDGTGATYYEYTNIEAAGGEYKVRSAVSGYVNGVTARSDPSKPFIRIGDHSHTTNQIQYYDTLGNFLSTYGDQSDKIEYLNSAEHPVSVAGGGNNTYDYGIQDFWTFIPAEPVTTESTEEIIKIIDGEAFNLTGQVFYDKDKSGDYDSMADSDTLLAGVTLNLYRETKDAKPETGKTYFTVTDVNWKVNSSDTITMPRKVLTAFTGETFATSTKYYEIFKTDVTPVAGRYFFTNIPYTDGETFVYEVVRPDASFTLTSGSKKPAVHTMGSGTNQSKNGSYALYAYDANGYGKEVQVITVDKRSTVNPDSNVMSDENHTITAVDVGYHYEPYTKLTLKKSYAASPTTALPATTVFEVRYVDGSGVSHVYDELAMARIENMEYTYELLSSTMNGAAVRDWYVSAEYYILEVDGETYIFKHSFDYDPAAGAYNGFVGTSQYMEISDTNHDGEINQKDIGDKNGDGVSNWMDLSILGTEGDESGTTWKNLPGGGFNHSTLPRGAGQESGLR